MQIVIDIPSAFIDHYHNDRFYDALMRLSSDAHLLAGQYEKETAAMLIKALEKAVEVPEHGRLIDADTLIVRMKKDPLWKLVNQYGVESVIEAAPTIW